MPISSISFDLSSGAVTLEKGGEWLFEKANDQITRIEESGNQRLIHFQTDYQRDHHTSRRERCGDYYQHSTNYVAIDGFAFIAHGKKRAVRVYSSLDDLRVVQTMKTVLAKTEQSLSAHFSLTPSIRAR